MKTLRAKIQPRLAMLHSPRARKFLNKGAWGLADHAMMSLTNFLTMVLLARVLTPRDFGFYALVYTTLIFLSGVQSALVSQPHTMLGSARPGPAFVRYTTNTACTQILLAAITGLVVLLCAIVAWQYNAQLGRSLLACAPATAAWQMQEFIRRVMYTRSRLAHVFINDLVSYGGQLVVIVILWRIRELGPVTALTAITITSALATVLGVWQIREYFGKLPGWREFSATTAENWAFGKWLLGGNLAQWTSARIYPLLAAGFVSIATTGVIKATQTLIGPTHIFMYALDPLVGPKAAKTYAKGGAPALHALILRVQLMVLVTIGGYCVVVALLAKPLLTAVYGSDYTEFAWFLVVLSVITIFKTIRSPLRLALSAIGETSALFRLRLVSSVANLTVGVAAVYFFGLPGLAFGMVMDEVVMQIVMWHFYLSYTGSESPITALRYALKPVR